MKITSIAGRHSQARAALGRWTRALLSLCMVGLPLEGALAMGFAAGGQGAAGREMVGPLRDRPREQRVLEADSTESGREARIAEWRVRLVWLNTLFQCSDESAPAILQAHNVSPMAPRAAFEVYKHGRVIDPSTYLHHASR